MLHTEAAGPGRIIYGQVSLFLWQVTGFLCNTEIIQNNTVLFLHFHMSAAEIVLGVLRVSFSKSASIYRRYLIGFIHHISICNVRKCCPWGITEGR